VRTVFVDRDGVINVNRPDHAKSWDEFEFLPGAIDGLALLTKHGFKVIIVTNQAIVNRGLISQEELNALHDRMVAVIANNGGQVAAVLVCPHRPEDGCRSRKPAPGLLFEAQERYGANLAGAVLIGDDLSDLEAARRAGCHSILVLSGRVSSWSEKGLPEGCLAVIPDLRAAASYLTAERWRNVGAKPEGQPAEGEAVGLTASTSNGRKGHSCPPNAPAPGAARSAW
jgi:D-glycero-D-manno-heptose 1,7-bisphosphate phosphatase